MPPGIKRITKSILSILVLVWIILSFMIYLNQTNLVYVPSKTYVDVSRSFNINYEEHQLLTNDGEKIDSWWVPHSNPRATVLFFHGNGGNISTRLETINIFHQLGLSVFIIDYRGYGDSTGSPSEEGTYIDAETAWFYLTNKLNINKNDIIIFGRSLGGAVAIWLAGINKPLALIVESSFTSMIDMGKHNYPYLPISLLAKIKYPSDEKISSVTVPKLFIHSKEDDIVPYKFGIKLFNVANTPKEFLEINGLHNDGFLSSGDKYTNGIDNYIKKILKR